MLKVHPKRMGPIRIWKRVGTNAYELDRPVEMTSGPMYNVPFYLILLARISAHPCLYPLHLLMFSTANDRHVC